jgi:hypothetical protein
VESVGASSFCFAAEFVVRIARIRRRWFQNKNQPATFDLSLFWRGGDAHI